MSDLDQTVLPKHVGYIIDGNRRWAKKYGLPAYEGHLAGYNAIKDVADATHKAGIRYMSVYIFSTENWKRSADEVSKLMGLVLRLITIDLPEFNNRGVRLRILGSREGVDQKVLDAIDNAEAETANNKDGVLALCFNYGGQLEVADAVKKIIQSGAKPEDVTLELIADNLYAPEVPPLDLVVRTSGEQRLSNFMLWRSAYSEFLFLKKMWPDMTGKDVEGIIKEYARRNRRFGG